MGRINLERGVNMGRNKMSIEEINNIVLSINNNLMSGMNLKDALDKNNVSIEQYNYWCKRLVYEPCTSKINLTQNAHSNNKFECTAVISVKTSL